MIQGSCECGAVRFTCEEVRPTVTVCHCGQCRRTSGHLWASTTCDADKLLFKADEALTWYASSDFAKRGFCSRCGSSLFYKIHEKGHYAVAAGALEQPSGLTVTKHIFAKDKADYYEITGDAPVLDTY